MSRNYKHIIQYEKEILEFKQKGLTQREIGEKLGYTKLQIKEFFRRYRDKQKQISTGTIPSKKGRPCKKDNELPPSIQKLDKLAQMRYEIASKDRYIKRLEMENELMRDFLSLAERK